MLQPASLLQYSPEHLRHSLVQPLQVTQCPRRLLRLRRDQLDLCLSGADLAEEMYEQALDAQEGEPALLYRAL